MACSIPELENIASVACSKGLCPGGGGTAKRTGKLAIPNTQCRTSVMTGSSCPIWDNISGRVGAKMVMATRVAAPRFANDNRCQLRVILRHRPRRPYVRYTLQQQTCRVTTLRRSPTASPRTLVRLLLASVLFGVEN